MRPPMTINLLGDIAAGKGTQATILVKKFKLKLIDTGEFTRRFWTGTSKISRRLEKTKLGKLTPTDVIKSFLRKEISALSKTQGVLIDGVKMPSEAKLFYRLLAKLGREPLVLYLHIGHKEIYNRLTKRFYDKKTGRPLAIDPQSVKNSHYRGREVIKRADDEPQAIKNRIDYYESVYSKTVKFWKDKGFLKVIDGKKPVDEVTKEIIKTVNKHYR